MLFNNNIHLDSISSTNNFLLSLRKNNIFSEGLYVTTDFQEIGKGQMNNSWESEKKNNLLISILIEPKISINNIFDINRFICLSIFDLLKLYDINALIKWPNDIIINNRKIAGILIENIFSNNIIIK
ncbi:MAG: biotin--[acetyl-CoA-carboxylase] ligase, partial [Flavobacteriales bacterium]|nr:biotin--[acetyl-CoA-carboxylase] ligase [Flavobacteriales bacterium]